jgi:hypothetical protein
MTARIAEKETRKLRRNDFFLHPGAFSIRRGTAQRRDVSADRSGIQVGVNINTDLSFQKVLHFFCFECDLVIYIRTDVIERIRDQGFINRP